jgi:hypothetical protein
LYFAFDEERKEKGRNFVMASRDFMLVDIGSCDFPGFSFAGADASRRAERGRETLEFTVEWLNWPSIVSVRRELGMSGFS